MSTTEDVTIMLHGCCDYDDIWYPGIEGWGDNDVESRSGGCVSVGAYDELRQENKAAYSQGYKDALRWIPVEERLPEGDHGHALIAYDKSGEKRVYVSFWCRGNDDSFSWNYDHAMKCVTHWMPLPEAPRSLPIPEAQK